MDEFPGRAFLFAAGGQDGPNPSGPPASPFRSGALSDFAVNDDGPKGLLSQIVGGRNCGVEKKTKIGTPVLVQSIGDILRFSGELFFRNKHSQVSLND